MTYITVVPSLLLNRLKTIDKADTYIPIANPYIILVKNQIQQPPSLARVNTTIGLAQIVVITGPAPWEAAAVPESASGADCAASAAGGTRLVRG